MHTGNPPLLERPIFVCISLCIVILRLLIINPAYAMGISSKNDFSNTYYLQPQDNTISGLVWLDTNGNGEKDQPETGLTNVTLLLYNSESQLAASAITGNSGHYELTNIPAGSYQLRIDVTTLPHIAGAPTYDPDGILNHKTPLNLSPNESLYSVDFGYAPTSATPLATMTATSTSTSQSTLQPTSTPSPTKTPTPTSTPTSTSSTPNAVTRPLPTITVRVMTATPTPVLITPLATPEPWREKAVRQLYLPMVFRL